MGIHVDLVLDVTELPRACITECAAPGVCDEAVARWQKLLDFTVDREGAIDCLDGYGDWTRAELEKETDAELARRVLWLACNDFKSFIAACEERGITDLASPETVKIEPRFGSPVFCLWDL